MSAIDEQIFDLSGACPFYGGNPEHCQLHEVRKVGFLERLSYIATLSAEEKELLISCHDTCIQKLEKDALDKVKKK